MDRSCSTATALYADDVKRFAIRCAGEKIANLPMPNVHSAVIVAEPQAVCRRNTVPICQVYDYVRNKVEAGFEDLGAQTLKKISEPVRVYRVSGTPSVPVTTYKLIGRLASEFNRAELSYRTESEFNGQPIKLPFEMYPCGWMTVAASGVLNMLGKTQAWVTALTDQGPTGCTKPTSGGTVVRYRV